MTLAHQVPSSLREGERKLFIAVFTGFTIANQFLVVNGIDEIMELNPCSQQCFGRQLGFSDMLKKVSKQ